MFKKIVSLFSTFFKIGLFTFGGGYAMIPLIERETVETHGWISSEDMLNILAISESSPGPISVNTATFVGYRVAGFFGAAAATLGVVLPSLIVIIIVSFFYMAFRDFKPVVYAFSGIRLAVAAMVLNAGMKFYKKSEKTLLSRIIIATVILITLFGDIHAIWLLIGSFVTGILVSLMKNKRRV